MESTRKTTVTSERITGPGTSLLVGLLTGATTGLIGAAASAPLRRLAGVSDRSLVNGISTVIGALTVWLALGTLHAGLRATPRVARRALFGTVGALAVVVTLVIYTALADYARRLPSLAEPLALLILLGGLPLFVALIERSARLPLRGLAPTGLVAAVLAALLVSSLDRTPAVHYSLSKLPAASNSGAPSAALTAPPAAATSAAPGGTSAAVATAAGSTGTPISGTAAPAAGAAGSAGTPPAAGPLHFTVTREAETAFTAHEKLVRLPAPSDAVGKTNSITGDVYLVPGKGLPETPLSVFNVDLRTLATDSAQRDRFIKMDTLQTSRFPMATYTASGIDGFPATYREGDEVRVTITGTMEIHGTQMPVSWTGTARYAAGRLEAVLAADITMTEFGMTPPRVPVVQSVDDKVHLDMHLVAAQQGA